jgi:hypothetical protein
MPWLTSAFQRKQFLNIEFIGMKRNKALFIAQTALIAILVGAIGFLINQNSHIKEKNRKILLQNDSIQSVNLILSSTIDTIAKKSNASILTNKLTVR